MGAHYEDSKPPASTPAWAAQVEASSERVPTEAPLSEAGRRLLTALRDEGRPIVLTDDGEEVALLLPMATWKMLRRELMQLRARQAMHDAARYGGEPPTPLDVLNRAELAALLAPFKRR
ncbi:MAG: hypothetical protein KC620_02830 [Myxococcales bacterium]|nr:hypothetical protein [Myxococcales bacterium]